MIEFIDASAERFALLFGLSLFFGFAFEEFYSERPEPLPGGVRTFPLLALAGGVLYLLDSYHAAFVAGLLIVGAWIYAHVRARARAAQPDEASYEGAFVVPAANLLAYVLGAVALTQPIWLCVTVAVAAVLLVTSKATLHRIAERVPREEVVTAAKFLILVGIVLPLLYNAPAIPKTSITPFGVWLAVVAVSTISYASYLLQTYALPHRGTIVAALLGGLYSSTATTVVLARRAQDEGMTPELESGIVAATGVMFLRILVVCAIFSLDLARVLVLPMAGLSVISLGIAWMRSRAASHTTATSKPPNPLQLGTAIVFAMLMVLLSLLTTYVSGRLGSAGVLGLAAVVGITDIDPFVLGIAQGGVNSIGVATAALAIVIAAASNNVLKAVYTVWFSRQRQSWVPAATLCALAAVGIGAGLLAIR